MQSATPTLAERCRAVELLVLDVDGVLTDGGVVYGTGGLEVKNFYVRDGTGLKLWKQAGKQLRHHYGPVVAVGGRARGRVGRRLCLSGGVR